MVSRANKSAIKSWLNQTFDKPFLIIFFFYIMSFWFFSFWVILNKGEYWGHPLGIPHHPFNIKLFDTNFIETVMYMYAQSPFYSIFTWLMLKSPGTGGFFGYIFLHYLAGFFALLSLYKLCLFLKINRWLAAFALSYFVFNPFFYRAFTSGWYDFLSMCLVSIMTFFLLRVVSNFTNKNLIYFILSVMLLCLYRNLFSPILFFLPIIIFLVVVFRTHKRKILLFSLLPLLAVFSMYIKNYILFGEFNVGPGQLATAYKSTTYQYQPIDFLLNEVSEGRLSPLVLCYSPNVIAVYNGVTYTEKTCREQIFPSFAAAQVDAILKERPYLKTPAVLQDSNNRLSGGDHLSNTLAGLVIGKQLMHDAKSFISHYPRRYVDSIRLNLMYLTRSNAEYEFHIANNDRRFPEWFNNVFNLRFLFTESLQKKSEIFHAIYNPLILIGLFCALVYALFYAGAVRRINFWGAVHFVGLLLCVVILHKRYAFFNAALIWTLLFLIVGLFYTAKENLFKTIALNDVNAQKRLLIAFMVFTCLYVMGIIDLVPGSEQERYRFAIEGLLLSLFLFWITNFFSKRKKV